MTTNEQLYKQIMDTLSFDPSIDASNITCSVKDNGVIVLGGTVKSFYEKSISEKRVKKIEGVKAIANELIVDLLHTYKKSDAEIAQAAMNALKWSVWVPADKIKIVVEDGHLTLSGEVNYQFQKENAYKAVRSLMGIKDVTNAITVKPNVDAVDVKQKIMREFERNARIHANNINVIVAGSQVTLKGKVQNWDEDKEARRAAWAAPGVSNVIDELEIAWY